MSETKLLPCPFCGGSPTAIETHPGRGELYCGNCDVVLGGDNAMTPDELTEAWNTRAERTCELDGTISWEWQAASTTFYTHSLSCGHDVTTTEQEPPNYCEECGAKVVQHD